MEASPGIAVDRAPEEQDQGSPSSLTAPAPRSPPPLPASTGQRIRHPSSPGWGGTTPATALCCEPPAHSQAGHPGKPCFFAKTAWSRTRSESALRGAGAVGGHKDAALRLLHPPAWMTSLDAVRPAAIWALAAGALGRGNPEIWAGPRMPSEPCARWAMASRFLPRGHGTDGG